MIYKLLLSGILFFLYQQILYSENLPSNSSLFKKLTTNNYLTVEFTQTTYGKEDPMFVKGVLYATRKGKFRLEYQEPLNEIYVSDGTTLLKYDPILEQLIFLSLKDSISQTAIGLITLDLDSLDKFFKIISCNKIKIQISCKLMPISKDSIIKTAEIFMDGNILKSINIKNYFSQKIILNFKKIQHDYISDNIFLFEPPLGTDVIKLNKVLQ
jgi:outer membrane lipoprotein carrier protein